MPLKARKWITYNSFLALLSSFFLSAGADQLTGRDYAVELTANIANEPPEITLSWPSDANARTYKIRRKSKGETVWRDRAEVEGTAIGFVDRDVQIGVGYEYQVIKDSSLGITAYGYIYSGINMPLVEDRGTVIVLTESSLAQALEPELLRLEFDLIGDGWTVERANVSPTNSSAQVKEIIRAIYLKDPSRTRALLLFGDVPVPYSGNIMPDGHENHQGAWPADVFYADVDGVWTDQTVDSKVSEQARQWNVPGDGKYDQDKPPSTVELQTGRVDLSNLTCFQNKTPSRSELDLARQYLDKNHRFRSGALPIVQRALVFDRIESKTSEPVAAMAWRNLAPQVGANVAKIGDFQYFPKVSSGTYLWSSSCSGGSSIASDGIGTSDAFALHAVNAVFTTFLGSYFGDWDNESAFLRASLGASGTILTTAYSGQPQWMFHHMALGETIGYSAKITQENDEEGVYPPHNSGAGEVHVSLLGDPTLRAHPVPAVRNLRGEQTAEGLVVGWQVPVIEGFIGFHVYTAPAARGPYRRVTTNPITQASYRIRSSNPGDYVMVRSLALTRTPSGSYYNSGVGVFYPDPIGEVANRPPDAPGNLSIAKVDSTSISLSWVSTARTAGYRIERKDPGLAAFKEIATTSADTYLFRDRALAGPGIYVYRVRGFNQFGSSQYSNEAVGSTLEASAEFVGLDFATQGNWIGAYGAEGFVIPGLEEHLPPKTSLITSNVIVYHTQLREDVRCPELTNSVLRSANCWVNGSPLGFTLQFTDEQTHQIAFYTAAWSRRNPEIKLEVLDAVTGTSLDKRTLHSIDEGAYVIYNVRRQVFFRVTPPSGLTNAEIYGLFFDRGKVAPPQIQPASGMFLGRTQVEISSATPEAEIRYTVDGSEPTQSSARYAGPLSVRSTVQIKARAFREGYLPSAINEATYVNTLPNLAGVISSDESTGGDWPSKYGSEGSWLPLGPPSFPGFAEISVEGGTQWSWTDETTDTRAPLASREGELRQARTWYSFDTMSVRLNIFDTNMHAVSLYFVDFDSDSRVLEMDILDPAGTLMDRIKLQRFNSGRYLTLGVQGQIEVRIKLISGVNAVLSGIFLDPAPPGLSPSQPGPLSALSVENGSLKFTAAVFPGSRLCLDRSTDLLQWQCWQTNVVTGNPAQFGYPIDPSEPKQFLRTHVVP